MLMTLALALAGLVGPDLAAHGAIVATDPSRSTAILSAGGRSRVVSVGETAFGARLLRVDTERVIVAVDGRELELRLTAGSAPAPVSAVAPHAPPPVEEPDAPPPIAEAKVAPLVLDRAEIQRRLALEVPRILAETAAFPYTQDGQVLGVSLPRIAEGTLLTDAGLRAGDVLVKMNGTPVDGMPTLIGLWTRLQSESRLRAEVLRDGQPVTLAVDIR